MASKKILGNAGVVITVLCVAISTFGAACGSCITATRYGVYYECWLYDNYWLLCKSLVCWRKNGTFSKIICFATY